MTPFISLVATIRFQNYLYYFVLLLTFSMVIKIGINGFGRIGRVILRTSCQVPELEVSAINDPGIDIDYVAYLIKFDSTHGKCKENVSYEQNEIKINGNPVKMFHQKLPADIPWQEAGVQYVVEASGMFTSLEKASGHLASDGVKRVLVTAPSSDVPMLILGVNEDRFNPGIKVISCASSTLYCLAPMMKLLQDCFEVCEGLVTSIHAMTPSLKPLDGLCVRGKHWRDHRSIHQNIIPAATGACRALGRIIPALKDKLTGLAFRVPIANVSVLDLSIRLNKTTSVKEIMEYIEKLKDSNPTLHKIIQVSREQAVSSDFIGDNHSCTLDIDSSLQLNPKFFKLICWYENEYSYACRVIETILFCDRQERTVPLPTKITFIRPRSCKAHSLHQQTDNNKKHVGIECISFPQLAAKPFETHAVKPFVRTTLKRPTTLFVCEASKPRQQLSEPDEFRTSIENYVKSCSVQKKISFHECTIASLQTNPKEPVRSHDNCLLKNFDLFTQSSSKKFENIFANRGTSSEMTGKINLSRNSSLQADFKKNADLISNKNKQLSRATEICGDIKPDNSFERSKTNSRSEIYPNTLKNDLNAKLRSLRELRNKNETKLLPKLKPSVGTITTVKCNETKDKTSTTNENDLGNEVDNQNEKDKPDIRTTNASLTENGKEKEDEKTNSPIIIDRHNSSEVIHIVSENIEDEVPSLSNNSQGDKKINETQQSNSLHTLKDIINGETENKGNSAMNETDTLLNRASSNIAIVDEKLKERNIVLTEYVRQSDVGRMNETIEAGDSSEQSCSFKGSSKDPIVIVSEESSSGRASPVNTVTTISNLETYRSKQDIYDKLDSASVSDSNNSFQMHEKKSQIINITDLNYSLEDLNRLDKICRIIEISDELSDKLFAPLDREPAASKKRWSFRDLCERIKLDEFCNDVFGKSAS